MPPAYAAAVALVLALGTWLFWPTLELGLFSDDYQLMAAINGQLAAPRAPLDLFNFVDGTPEDVRALQRLGSIAWWSAPDMRISFLRPLSSALLLLDRALFGRTLSAYHAHSIFAWALLVLAASALYLRLLRGVTVAAFATAFFAFDQSQHGPVIWICNRGALYALLLGLLGLSLHLRFRMQGGAANALLSAACLATALLFGEWGLPAFAYLLAYELAGATDAPRKRALALAPAAALALLFLAVRGLLGYGARGSGIYVDPGADPLRFALLLLHRIPVFVADLTFNLPAQQWDSGSPLRKHVLELELFPPWLWVELPGWRFFHLVIGLLAIACLGAVLRFCWRGLDREERVNLRWLLLGAALSLVPVAGAFPSTRLTLAASFGVAPAFALVLRQLARRLLDAPQLRPPRFLALYTLAAALLWLQLFDPLSDNLQNTVDSFTTTTAWVLAADLDEERVADQDVYVLNPSEFTTTFFFAYTWAYHDRPLPRSFVPLTIASNALDLERVADNALLLRPLGGTFMNSPAELHFRSEDQRFGLGDAVQLSSVRFQVVRMLAGFPHTLRLTFERSLDDPSQVFLQAVDGGLVRFAMPPVGQRAMLRRGAGPSWFALERGRDLGRIGPLPGVLDFDPEPEFVAFEP